jgi:hypothetical protein
MFSDIPDIQCSTTTLMRGIQKNDFRDFSGSGTNVTQYTTSQKDFFKGNSSR